MKFRWTLILCILTDSLRVMKRSSRNLWPKFPTRQTPICCPSRTETLSGRMYHNVLSDDLSGCMHVNSTGYIFQVGAQFNINFQISSGKSTPSQQHKIYIFLMLNICPSTLPRSSRRSNRPAT